MKTIEVQVTFTTQISDELAAQIKIDSSRYYVDAEPITLYKAENNHGRIINTAAVLNDYKTTNIEVI